MKARVLIRFVDTHPAILPESVFMRPAGRILFLQRRGFVLI